MTRRSYRGHEFTEKEIDRIDFVNCTLLEDNELVPDDPIIIKFPLAFEDYIWSDINETYNGERYDRFILNFP